MSATARSQPAATRELTLSRTVDAPRRLVFAAWTDPHQMARWWGPHGFTNPVCDMDVRPGGAIRIDMRGPDGTIYPMTGTFREVAPPARLVFTAVPVDAEGRALIEAQTTVTFAERAGRTELTVQQRATALRDPGAQMMQGMEPGWSQSLDRLAALVARA